MPGAPLIFDKYELVRRLAIGGMGEVFIARQVSSVPGFERHVILKSLLPDLASEPSFVEQFLDEARVAATLNHPNVVSVFEVGASQGTYYLAMEFIPGMNLAQVRRAASVRSPLPPHLLGRMMQEAAAGLHHAHLARDVQAQPLNLVHRDISPHNIMVREDGVTKVVDFGIASASNRATRTRTGLVKGKLAYMSPEQLRAEPLDGRSDQFSLGIVFWELLTNQRLFSGANEAKVAASVLGSAIAPPSTLGAPAALDAIVLKMLERDAAARFANCDEVSRAIEAWLKEQPPSDHTAIAAWLKDVAATELAAVNVTTPDDFVLKLRSGEAAQPRPSAPRGPNDDRLTVDQRSPAHPGTVEIPISEELAAAPKPALGRRLALGAVVLGVVMAAVLVARSGGGPQPPGSTDAAVAPLAVADTFDASVPLPETPDAGAPVVAGASLSISSRPGKAKIQLDGRWVGETPETLVVEPFTPHRLRVELDGYRKYQTDLKPLDAGTLLELEVKLERVGGAPKVKAPPVSGSAKLSVRCEPPADAVYLDGTYYGAGTKVLTTTPGKHVLELEAEGRRKVMEVVLQPDENRKLELKL